MPWRLSWWWGGAVWLFLGAANVAVVSSRMEIGMALGPEMPLTSRSVSIFVFKAETPEWLEARWVPPLGPDGITTPWP